MPTLGEELKQKREEQGITLAEIAESTRIGTRFLKAIEEGNFSTLPGGIFTRSFIRAYAKKVGMDEDEAITLYHRQTSDEPLPAPTLQDSDNNGNGEHVPHPPPVSAAAPALRYEAEKRGPSWLTVGVVVIVLLVIGGIAGALLTKSNNEGAKTADVSSASKQSKPGQSGQGQPASTPSQTASVSASLPAPGQPIDITLEATNGESWVRYQVDQGESATVILKPGESKSLPPAHNEIKLSLGNRTTLKLKIDNRDANFPAGTPNFAAQVVISHDNLHTYIPN